MTQLDQIVKKNTHNTRCIQCACMYVTHTQPQTHIQVWACLRVKGKHTDCCSHHKNLTSLNCREGLIHCSKVSSYTRCICLYVCVYTSHLAQDERETLHLNSTRKGEELLMFYKCASMCTHEIHLIGKVSENYQGRRGGVER